MEQIDLIEGILRHAPQEGFNETDVQGLRLYRQDSPTLEPMPVVYEPSVCVIIQGSKRLLFGERSITYDPWNFLVNVLTLPLHAEIPEASPERPFLGFLIRFDPIEVGTLIGEMEGKIDWNDAMRPQVISACPLSDHLARPLSRLIGSLDDAMDRQILAPGLIREILYGVIRGPKGWLLREQALQGGRAQRVARAVAYVEQHFRENLSVERIAQEAGMSPSVLHQHFKQLTALTPMQFVQHLRLHHARALLMGGRGSAEAGFEVGYNSPSQFSREFRRLFGAPPSRIRSVAPAWQAQTGGLGQASI